MDYIELDAVVKPIEIGREVLVAQLSEIGFESFVDKDNGVKAYIQSDDFNENLLQDLWILKNDEFEISYLIKNIEDQNWNKAWEENFEPIDVEGACHIRAPFHNKNESFKYDIIIDPKMSFGTGHHATTYLMAKQILLLDIKGKKVLDMGCGTAVLAILAKQKGATYVEAIDIEEWAYNNSLENIRNNNCDDIIVRFGGAELLGNEKFDIVFANINRNILLTDMHLYANNLIDKGVLLLSGFFRSDVDILVDEAAKNSLSLTFSESKNDWTILQFIKE
ncbi:MAG: 50S ribosomal protein L11 methyltransferase [Vicingaceae bacterium]|nr:50S ribosomal protein L11 methyltransferase [Vicingaceae bacterium]